MMIEIRARRSLKAGLWQPAPKAERRYGKSAPSPPAAPDPAAVGAAQSAANKEAVTESARVNQINEVSPFGSQTYTGDIGAPDRTRTTTLNPTDQQTLDTQRKLALALTGNAQQLQTQVGTETATPFTLDGVPKLPGNLEADRANVSDAVYRRNTQYLDPQFDTQDRQMRTRLTNQGLVEGDEAWNRSMDEFGRQKQAAYSDARDAAIQAGGAEQSRMFGLAQASRQQGISDTLLQRQEPMNELAAVLQGSPALQAPSFGSPAQYNVAPADITGAYGLAQAGKNAAYQGGVQAATAGNSALAGLGGSALMAGAFF
jgi:hypothetical protein